MFVHFAPKRQLLDEDAGSKDGRVPKERRLSEARSTVRARRLQDEPTPPRAATPISTSGARDPARMGKKPRRNKIPRKKKRHQKREPGNLLQDKSPHNASPDPSTEIVEAAQDRGTRGDAGHLIIPAGGDESPDPRSLPDSDPDIVREGDADPSKPRPPQPIIRNLVPSLLGREFSSWDEWFKFFEQYERMNLMCYRTRDSQRVQAFNRERVRAGRSDQQIPTVMEYARRKYQCTLGCQQRSRSTGQRERRMPRFTGCVGAFHLRVVAVQAAEPPRWFVKVIRENLHHNHRISTAIYTALRSSRDLMSGHLLDQLDAFVDTNTETRQIVQYMADRLDLPISSQQIRNLINARLGDRNAEDRLKLVLSRYVEMEGHTCLLVQDEWDQTCGIVLQSAAQKAIFQQWGESLVLDWTHNTNNLGFYLGGLITTVATGRGVSVLDFLCLNQRKETLIAVIQHFKDLNPAWVNVQTVVIDKDFAEWKALEEVLPSAKILLCQFHAMSYVRRIIAGPKYFVPLSHRAEVEGLFRVMLYAPTEERYNFAKANFCDQVKKRSKTLVGYFTRNWDSCSSMWSNYGRRIRFSGGNTTTNRIEASWNQFKQLLGKKTSIDKCIRVIIQQQVAVMRQLLNSLTQFEVSAPATSPLPRALRPLGEVLSPYCLARVRRQWDLHVLHNSRWSWTREGTVYSASPGSSPVNVTWSAAKCSCDCLFYMSTLMPCQHIFNVLSRHRHEDAFQVAQLDKRWSMVQAKTVEPALLSCISHLAAVRKLRDSIGDPTQLVSDETLISLPTTANRRIRYVKLARGQGSNCSVLSLCEKYNVVHAELFPVVDALQNLSSNRFYEVFADLRAVMGAFTSKWDLHVTATDENDISDDELDEVDQIDEAALVGLVDRREDDAQDSHLGHGGGDSQVARLASDAADEPLRVTRQVGPRSGDAHVGHEVDATEGTHGRDQKLAHSNGDALAGRVDIDSEIGQPGRGQDVEHDGGDPRADRSEDNTADGFDGRDRAIGCSEGNARVIKPADVTRNGPEVQHQSISVDEVNSCHTQGHVDEYDDWAFEPDAELEPYCPGGRAPSSNIAAILKRDLLRTDPPPFEIAGDACDEAGQSSSRSTRPQIAVPSSADLIDPSQVSLPELHLSELSQELLRTSDALLRRADEVPGESDMQDEQVSMQVKRNAHNRESLNTVRRAPDSSPPLQRGKGAISQLAKAMKRRVCELERLARGESESDEYESDWESSESEDSSDPDFPLDQRANEVAQLRSVSTRLSIVQLPRPISSSSAVKRKGPRRAAVEATSNCPIRIDQLMRWVLKTPDIDRAGAVLRQYPVLFSDPFLAQKNPTVILQRARPEQLLYTFAIPRVLVGRVNSALQQWLEGQDELDLDEDPDTASDTPVAFITSELAPLSRAYVDTVHAFYEARDTVDKFKDDLSWLEMDWSHHTGTAIQFFSDIQLAPAALAAQVAQLFRSCCLSREFALKTEPHGSAAPSSVTLRQLIGRLAGDQRINDAAMNASAHAICRRFPGCVAFDPVAVRSRDPAILLPDAPLVAHRCILVPVFRPGMAHWLLQVIIIEKQDGPRPSYSATVHMYDPLAMNSNFKDIQNVWVEFTRPLLRAWHNRNMAVGTDADGDIDDPTNSSENDRSSAGGPGSEHGGHEQNNERTGNVDEPLPNERNNGRVTGRQNDDERDDKYDDGPQAMALMPTSMPVPISRSTRKRRSLRLCKTDGTVGSAGSAESTERMSTDGTSTLSVVDKPDAPFPPFSSVTISQVAQPVQHDSVSCGIYCLVQAHSFADGTHLFQQERSATPTDIEVARLRILWELTVNASSVERDAASDWVAVEEIGKQVTRYFRTVKLDTKATPSKKK